MMLLFVPEWMLQTEMTKGLTGSIILLEIPWSATITCAATKIGSTVSCGAEPCPPLPITVILKASGAAIAAPPLRPNAPDGTRLLMCSPKT